MSKIYNVRDKSGVLKFKLPKEIALAIITSTKGTWRTANYTSGEVNQYVLEEEGSIGIHNNIIMLYVWVGDKIDVIEN